MIGTKVVPWKTKDKRKMKRMWGTASISLGTLMLISITLSFSSAAKIPWETKVKKGDCPKVQISEGHECPMPPDLEDMVAFNEFLLTVAECVVDADCNGTDKCCFDGCKTLCVSMKHAGKQLARQEDQFTRQENILLESSEDETKSKSARPPSQLLKQGKCPFIKQPNGGCQQSTKIELGDGISCKTDEDCVVTEGCCFDGCHFRCIEQQRLNLDTRSKESGAGNGAGKNPGTVDWTFNSLKRATDPLKFKTEKQKMIQANVQRKKEFSTEISENPKMNRRLYSGDERTFVKIWPTGVSRGLVGAIIGRFERKGYALVGMKLTKQKEHCLNKKLHLKLKTSIQNLTTKDNDSHPIVVMVWKGPRIINSVQNMIGPEDPSRAKPGTINGDHVFEGRRRIIEAAEDSNEAEEEIKFWFTKEELVD